VQRIKSGIRLKRKRVRVMELRNLEKNKKNTQKDTRRMIKQMTRFWTKKTRSQRKDCSGLLMFMIRVCKYHLKGSRKLAAKKSQVLS